MSGAVGRLLAVLVEQVPMRVGALKRGCPRGTRPGLPTRPSVTYCPLAESQMGAQVKV